MYSFPAFLFGWSFFWVSLLLPVAPFDHNWNIEKSNRCHKGKLCSGCVTSCKHWHCLFFQFVLPTLGSLAMSVRNVTWHDNDKHCVLPVFVLSLRSSDFLH